MHFLQLAITGMRWHETKFLNRIAAFGPIRYLPFYLVGRIYMLPLSAFSSAVLFLFQPICVSKKEHTQQNRFLDSIRENDYFLKKIVIFLMFYFEIVTYLKFACFLGVICLFVLF